MSRIISLQSSSRKNLILAFLSVHFVLVTFFGLDISPILALNEAKHAREKLKCLQRQDIVHSALRNATPATTTTHAANTTTTTTATLGTVVILAPQRTRYGYGHTRICLLRSALVSIDRHLNAHHGPYDVHIVVSSDYHLDPEHLDGPYTESDRDALRTNLSNSPIVKFVEIAMYSDDALEPNLNLTLFQQRWMKGLDGGTGGRNLGYRSMCRLWSGRLQRMDFLSRYRYYMRMDDDSLLTAKLSSDPFQDMEERKLQYAYYRSYYEPWGIDRMWQLAMHHMTNATLDNMYRMGWLSKRRSDDGPGSSSSYEYKGIEPYNNFHVATVSMWNDSRWLSYSSDVERVFGFFRHRFGDATVHAFAMGMLLRPEEVELWNTFPYVHNMGMPTYGLAVKCDRALDVIGGRRLPKKGSLLGSK